jgi:hypothetical protein
MMTEAEWQDAADPGVILEFAREHGSDRKLRLFAYGCCRENWHLLREYRGHRDIIEKLEEVMDGSISRDEFELVSAGAEHPVSTLPVSRAVHSTYLPDPLFAAHYASL